MATPPKLVNGKRITVKKKSYGKVGRPKGTRLRRKFEETKLGFFLKYEAPIEYELIMQSTPQSAFPEPKINVIEAIAISSHNPVFEKGKYYRYLEEYRINKCSALRPKILTEKRKAYYERILNNQIERYIEDMRKRGYKPY